MNGHSVPDRQHLPDPWLFDSEALLRELARCRETALQIPITNPNATHFGVQLTVNAIFNLEENLRYLLHLHRDGQRSFRKKHDADLQQALDYSGEHNWFWRIRAACAIIWGVEDNDANQEALEQVERITESEPVSGEDLLGSEKLKSQLREAKERERQRSQKPKPWLTLASADALVSPILLLFPKLYFKA
jgi:hypothetical protein